MHKRTILPIILFLLFSSLVYAADDTDPLLLPIVKDGKLGYINTSGEIVIEPQFYFQETKFQWGLHPVGYGFFEGLTCVSMRNDGDKRWGYIDKSGNWVVDPQFYYANNFSDGLARVGVRVSPRSTLYGFIDKTGEFVIPPKYKSVSWFNDGVAFVNRFWMYGLIDKSGKYLMKPQFNSAQTFQEGMAVVSEKSGHSKAIFRSFFREKDKYGYINLQGETVVEPIFEDAEPFYEGFAEVELERDKWTFINKKGEFITFKTFKRVDNFSDGLAAVCIPAGNGKSKRELWGFIDKTGEYVIEPQFDNYSYPFSDGLIGLRLSDDRKNHAQYGYINKKGEVVIAPRFDRGHPFKNGYALVEIEYYLPKAKKMSNKNWETLYGWIDKEGNYIWEPTK